MNADVAQMNVQQVSFAPLDPASRTWSHAGVRSSALHLRSSAFPKLLASV